MDTQSHTFQPFNLVNYISSVAGATLDGTVTVRVFSPPRLYQLKVHEISMHIDCSPLIHFNSRSLKF